MDIFEQIKQITDPAVIKAILNAANGKKAEIGGRVKKVDEGKKLAEELQEFTNTIHAAKDAYVSKGFNVEIKTNKNGLVTKWSLKRSNTIGGVKTLRYEEFTSILGRLGDSEFGSKQIMNALIGSGIGARKLQPTLGLILRGSNGPSPIEKVPGTDKAGTLYRKVK